MFAVILGKSHYLLYTLATAMYPRWLVTLDEDLEPLPVTVRVGQVSDVFSQSHFLCNCLMEIVFRLSM